MSSTPFCTSWGKAGSTSQLLISNGALEAALYFCGGGKNEEPGSFTRMGYEAYLKNIGECQSRGVAQHRNMAVVLQRKIDRRRRAEAVPRSPHACHALLSQSLYDLVDDGLP